MGTTSVEKSERLSDLLKKKGIKHVVLNAKYHEKEAEIVAQAGRKGAITIATNMAGRGTDILLGGNSEFMAKQECIKKGLAQPLKVVAGEVTAKPDDPNLSYFYYGGNEYQVPTAQWNEINARHKEVTDAEHDEVVSLGGLFIFGTERHEARRIDNQLRGRAGRQGDPGASRFYLSLEDDLMRIFAKEWVSNLLQRLGMEEGVPIESRLITRRIEAAQKAVEGQNFEARKHLLEYDDVMNKQRQAVYGLRRQLLEGIDQKELILEDYVRDILGGLLDKYAAKETHAEDWDIKSLKNQIFTRFGVDIAAEGIQAETLNRQELGDTIFDKLKERYDAKEKLIGPDAMRHHERIIMLSVIDQQWKDHLLSMDHLREGIGLRGYGQHDPLVEYKRESFDMFEAMMERFEEETVRYLYLMQVIEAPSRPVPQHAISAGDFDGTAGGRRRSAPARDAIARPLRWTTWKKPSSAASAANWNRRAWRAQARPGPCSKWSAERRSAATILARVAAGRNTRSAAGRRSAVRLRSSLTSFDVAEHSHFERRVQPLTKSFSVPSPFFRFRFPTTVVRPLLLCVPAGTLLLFAPNRGL